MRRPVTGPRMYCGAFTSDSALIRILVTIKAPVLNRESRRFDCSTAGSRAPVPTYPRDNQVSSPRGLADLSPPAARKGIMAHVDALTDATHKDIKALAAKHDSFAAFMHDLQLLGEKLWHNSKSQNEQDQSVQSTPAARRAEADAEQAKIAARNEEAEGAQAEPGPTGDPAEGAQTEAGPTDEGTPVTWPPAPDNAQQTTPAEPASPVSDAGLPTSNVDVVVGENLQEGTSVPVQHNQ